MSKINNIELLIQERILCKSPKLQKQKKNDTGTGIFFEYMM